MFLATLLDNEVASLFLIALLALIVLHDLITGQVAGRFGGWVTRREKEPDSYKFYVLMEVGLLVFLARLALHHWWKK